MVTGDKLRPAVTIHQLSSAVKPSTCGKSAYRRTTGCHRILMRMCESSLGLVGTIALAIVVAAAPARADEPTSLSPPPSPSRPGPLPPVAGLMMIGAGAYLNYHYAAYAKNENPRCSGIDRRCLWLGLVGLSIEEIGGALGAWWAWRLGESDFGDDARAARPVKDRNTLAVTGLVLAGVGVALSYGATIYRLSSQSLCTSRSMPNGIDYGCQADGQYTVALANLISLPFIVVGATLAGYGFGYRTAARTVPRPREVAATDLRLFPLTWRGGAGLALHAAF